MPSTTKEPKKGPKPPKHWTQNIQATTVSWAEDGRLHFSVKGGAENGQFVFISDVKQDRVVVRSGKIHVDEILLEINGMKVAGYTLWDIHTLFNDYKDQLLHIKSVKPGQSLTKDLRKYLNIRFQKGSVDHELQQTIRENLYFRTVPCTTRAPRDGEVDGVDYKFLSPNEFMALEKSGHLLESGIFDGNHYGTPKPPKSPPPESPPESPLEEEPHSPIREPSETENDSRTVTRAGATPSSTGKRQRNKSTIDATTGSSDPVDEELEESRRKRILELEEKYGPLGSNWEISFTEDGDMYYIDHEREVTQWHDPREESKEGDEEDDAKKSESDDNQSEELPYGWEKIEDPQYGTYYIDHVHRKTQYESPVPSAKVNGEQAELVNEEVTKVVKEQTVQSAKPSVEPRENGSPLITTEKEWHHLFTSDPEKLKGTRLKTSLFKSRNGFGFTIIGGDEADEFLQIKSILPEGPAFEDGKLETGDVLVYVNDTKVLGTTHQQVVSLFQTISPGEKVTLDVCRGYPLPFDPSDPNTNIVTTYAVEPPKSPGQGSNNDLGRAPASPRRPVRSASVEEFPNHHNGKDHSALHHGEGRRHGPRRKAEHDLKSAHARSLPDLTQKGHMNNGDDMHHPLSKPETIVVEFVKGPDGFGFTLADSPYGQKIKQVLAPERCKGLQKGDILVEVNSDVIQRWPHAEVVKKLKECPQGAKARIVIHRGGYIKPSKNPPRSPQGNHHVGDRHSPDRMRYPDERKDHLRPPPDRRGYRHQNDREPFQRDADRRRSEPPPRSHDVYRPSQVPNHVPIRVERFNGEQSVPQGDGYEADRHSLGGVSLDSHQQRYYPDRAQPPYLNDPKYRSSDRLIRQHSQGQLQPSPPGGRDAQSHFIESTIFLKKGEGGFGFRIVGGIEEGTQVTVGNIVQGGAADQDGRLQSGDQILYIDGQPVSSASHSKVVTLMNNAGHIGRVSLGIRRIVPLMPRESTSPSHSRSSLSTIITSPVDARSTEVVLTRHESEGFGFVVISSHLKSGTSIGRITKGSPADRNGWLKIGDHIIAINGIDITNMPHKDIVNLIKDTGLTVSLTVGAREGDPLSQRSPSIKGDRDFTSAQAIPAQVKGTDSIPSPMSQSPRHTLPLNHKPPEPIYAQSSKMRPLNSQPPPQQTPIRVNHLPPRGDVGNTNTFSRSAFEKDPRGPATNNQLPPYNRPPSVPLASPNKTMPRSMEPLRRDQAPLSHTDGPTRTNDHPVDNMVPRRAPTDPRAATLGRVPNRYPPNREAGFRPMESNTLNRLPPGQRTPPGQMTPPGQRTPPKVPGPYQRDEAGQVYSVEVERGPTGFGFSLRGGKEYNTPFYVLRMAENGPAARQGVMRIGDQLLKINNVSTDGMTHKDAIDVIRTGGNRVALTLQRPRHPPVVNVGRQRPSSLYYVPETRRTAQTPPPVFRNAPLSHSNISLQSSQPRLQDQYQAPQNLDTSWTYRSLPRKMGY